MATSKDRPGNIGCDSAGDSQPTFLSVRSQIRTPADAVRWACVLEATAPKAGNVTPEHSFSDLCFQDFIQAANVSAAAFDETGVSLGQRIERAVIATRAACHSNVNLGIVLLMGPLVRATELLQDVAASPAREIGKLSPDELQASVAVALSKIDRESSQCIFRAIAAAGAGGMGEVDQMDVRSITPIDAHILDAMKSASHRDGIALQYADDFADLFGNVVPVIAASLSAAGDISEGICRAHVQLLSQRVDTLVARKCGDEIAEQVRRQAAATDTDDLRSLQKLDDYLRSDGHRLNPGTTADLIAAALYVLLVCDQP